MRIPVIRSTNTRPSAPAEGYAEAGRPVNYDSIIAQQLEDGKKDLEEFDLNNRLVQEMNELQSDFETRKQGAPLGAAGFTDQTLNDYEARHEGILEEYWKRGYSDDALRNFSTRLGGLRQNFGERALGFQVDSVGRLADKELGDFTVRLSQFATGNPDGYASAVDELRENVWKFPGLQEAQRETIFEANRSIIRQGAAKGLALQNPGLVIDALDPQGFTAPVKVAPAASGGAYANVTGWQGVATNVATALGLNAEEVAAVMSFESAGTFDPNIEGGDGGRYMGLIQFGPEERRKYGIEKGSSPEQWTNAILGFMNDRGFRPGMQLEDFYSTILAGRPGRYDAKDSNGTSVRNAIPRILADHLSNAQEWLARGSIQSIDPGAPQTDIAPPLSMVGAPQPVVPGNLPLEVTQVVKNDDGSISTVRTISVGVDGGEVLIPTAIGGRVVSDEEAIAHYKETGENFGTFSTAEEATAYAEALHRSHEGQVPRGADGIAEAFNPSVLETGNAILDDMNGPERLQVLAWAREQQNKVTSTLKASMDVTIANAAASISTGEYAGPQLTREQVIEVYGPVEGEQRWAQYEGSIQAGQVVQRIKTMNPLEVQRELARLQPDPAKETYAQDLSIYQAAERAAASVTEARDKDPAAYVFQAFPEVGQALADARSSEQRVAAYAQMRRAYERLGIPEDKQNFFTKDMMEEVASEYRAADPTGKFALIQQYITEMGPEMAGRTLGQAGGKELAQDMVMYATLARTPNFRTTFSDVLRGKAIIEKDPARRPSADVLNQEFAMGISTAINNLNPDVSRSINEAAAALYVLRGGTTVTGGLLSDKALYTNSLREVLGGTTNARTGMVQMGRDKVTDWTILPPGVSQTQFENWLESRGPGDLTALNPNRRPPVDRSGRPLPIDRIIDEGVFVMLAPGRYGIKLDSDGKWVADTAGNRFEMNIALFEK
jgi:hypothetical protein